MNRYSVSDAIFFAISHNKQSKHFWRLSIVYVGVKLTLLAAFMFIALPFLGSILGALSELENEGESVFLTFLTQIEMLSNIQSLSGILFLPVFLAVIASFYRWTLKDQWNASRFGLRFGETELQLFVVFLAVYGMIFVGMFVLMLPIALVIGIVVAVSGDVGGAGMALVSVLGVVGVFAVIAGIFWLSIKLSLSAALTVRDGQIRIFESFSASKGHFWKLFGSHFLLYVIAWVIGMILTLIMLLVAAPFVFAGYTMFGFSPDPSDYGAILGLAAIPLVLFFVFGTLLEYWMYVSSNGIAVYFLRWKNEQIAEEKEAIFGPEEYS